MVDIVKLIILAPGRVQHRESAGAFQQMPQISEGEQGHRMDYTPKRPRHVAMPTRVSTYLLNFFVLVVLQNFKD